jgi:hypothetical protein
MHAEAWTWVNHCRSQMRNAGRVLEIGSYNHNGTARDVFQPISTRYIGVDVIPGRGVDVIGNITDREFFWYLLHHYGYFDTIICTETLEHTPAAPLIDAMMELLDPLAPKTRLILTCAGPGRTPHGHDGGPVKENEWYANVSHQELADMLNDSFLDLERNGDYNMFVQSSWNSDVSCDTYACVEFIKK